MDLLPSTYIQITRNLRQCMAITIPKIKKIDFDNGSEFKAELKELRDNMGLKWRPNNAYGIHNQM